MKTLVAFCILLAVANGLDIKPPKPYLPVLAKDDANARISHGKPAYPNQFKYQVGLTLSNGNNSIWCGGSLISHTWVLTSASCTVGMVNATVQLGGNNRLKPALQFTVLKKDIFPHSGYSNLRLWDDIGLIRIPAVKYTHAIQNIDLPKMRPFYSTYEGDIAVASGWGRTTDASLDMATQLQYAYFKVISNELCAKTYGTEGINAGKLCVASNNSISACEGDYGGPLVLRHTKVIIGVASFAAADGCEYNHPVAFTRVTAYLPWIKNITGLHL